MKIQVIVENQKFFIDIEDIHKRPVIAYLDGEKFEVWPERQMEEQNEEQSSETITLPIAISPTTPNDISSDLKYVTAPLPGVITSIEIKEGDPVNQGQTLCTLEAMKMKNAIRSSRDGTISDIHVSVGQQVNHGEKLFSFQK
jgi:biotin carboxyl carrier protein